MSNPTSFHYAAAGCRIPRLTQQQRHLLLYYCFRSQGGKFHHGYETIKRETALCYQTIAKFNKLFRELGVLTWTKGHGNQNTKGKNVSNHYELNLNRMRELGSADSTQVETPECSADSTAGAADSTSSSADSTAGAADSTQVETKNPCNKEPFNKEPVNEEGAQELFSGDGEGMQGESVTTPTPTPESLCKSTATALVATSAHGANGVQNPFFDPPPPEDIKLTIEQLDKAVDSAVASSDILSLKRLFDQYPQGSEGQRRVHAAYQLAKAEVQKRAMAAAAVSHQRAIAQQERERKQAARRVELYKLGYSGPKVEEIIKGESLCAA